MKKLLLNVSIGILLYFILTIVMLFISMPLGDPEIDPGSYVTKMWLLSAIPTLLVSYLAALLSKTWNLNQAVERGVTWTSVYALFMVLTGVGNGTMGVIWGSWSFYLLLLAYFAGPVLYVKTRKR